ncbi:trihelix transcription factor PTL-like [Salvia divinorum]|uniref:Trihelix transcription factor PTL-like n=1 Tax=Salvia divinorum TaxID=28513 RepID=A0ABD1IBF1_SALDI
MEDQYGMGDLREYIDGGRPLFPAISQPPDLLSCHRSSTYPYDMLIFRPQPSDAAAAPSATAVGFDGGAGRWPRQETLTLLEIRSRLDPKFKEANQKIPLWDEVSRIMSQEHGYQRSGKKCREKFENLYKYYKKTKDGKAGRQDGKHYRFFRQLEALYGDATTAAANSSAADFHYNDLEPYYPLSKISDASLPDSCDCDATSSRCTDSDAAAAAENDARMRKRRGKMRSLKASIDEQMRVMAEKQDAWMEKMTRAIEGKEEERLVREDQWRRQDAARIDGEHKMWAAEKAWIEARDTALMDAFNNLFEAPRPPPQPLLQENGVSEWDEIAAKMAACGGGGGERSGHVISDYLRKCSRKRKEGNAYDQNSDRGVAGVGGAVRLHGHGNGGGEAANDGLFRYLVGDSYQRL